ncbi:MAG: DUF393 domain-containing protein [Bacteriovoracaceae bacterium]|nr:DUF393 domain-containing protein [Bacteriovoracaceae bacterium]
MNLKLPILLFDSECQLCNRFKMALERIDTEKSVSYLPVNSKEVYEQFPELDPKECMEYVHLIDENGKIHKGSEVVVYLASNFPSISKHAWLLETKMGEKVVDFFYSAVNHYRKSSLTGCKNCNRSKTYRRK